MVEDLRRIPRVSVCSRAVVRDRYGVWTGVTDDVCARGCQVVTNRLLRIGSTVEITLSSDLFDEELETTAQVVWSSQDRLGLIFLDPSTRPGAIRPEAWMAKVLEHSGTELGATRVVPSVHRRGARAVMTTSTRNGRLVRTAASEPEVRVLQPARRA